MLANVAYVSMPCQNDKCLQASLILHSQDGGWSSLVPEPALRHELLNIYDMIFSTAPHTQPILLPVFMQEDLRHLFRPILQLRRAGTLL